MNKVWNMALAALAAVGLAAAAHILIHRIGYEKAQDTVEVILDMNDVQRLARPEPGGLEKALDMFRDAGATTVGVYEESLADVFDSGRALRMPYFDFQSLKETGDRAMFLPHDTAMSRSTYAVFREPGVSDRYKSFLKGYFGQNICLQQDACLIPLQSKNIEELTLGFDVPKTGLAVALRPSNNFTETPETLKMKFAAWDSLSNKSMIIFDGTTVLGFPRMVKNAADEFKARPGMPLGVVELVEQDGIQELSKRARTNVVQVHSITQREMEVMKEDAAVVRMVRAVRERKIQALYMRLFAREAGLPPDEALKYNVKYVKDVVGEVRKTGKKTGLVAPIGEFKVSKVAKGLAAAGAAALVLLLFNIVFKTPSLPSFIAALGVFAAYIGAAHFGKDLMVMKLTALGIACFLPGLSACAFFLTPYSHYDGPGETMPIGRNLYSWLAASLLTAAGGVMIATLLADRSFFLRIELFAGVKLALVAPFMIVIFCFLRTSRVRAQEFFDSPVRYIEAVAAAVLLAAVAVYLIRSGNQGPVGGQSSGGFEHSMRNWLEAVFIVRPRTKEFLFGHPAMILLGLVPFKRKNYMYLVVLLAGVVGQAGLLNTFCHLHSPFWLSAARVAMGMIMGMIVGVALRTFAIAAFRLIRPAAPRM